MGATIENIKKFRDKYVSHADINEIEKLKVPYLSEGFEMVFISYEIFALKNRMYNKNLKLEFEQIYKDTQHFEK